MIQRRGGCGSWSAEAESAAHSAHFKAAASIGHSASSTAKPDESHYCHRCRSEAAVAGRGVDAVVVASASA